MIVNQYGKPWDELDYLKMMYSANCEVGKRSFSISTEQGSPLCGRYIEGSNTVYLRTKKYKENVNVSNQ